MNICIIAVTSPQIGNDGLFKKESRTNKTESVRRLIRVVSHAKMCHLLVSERHFADMHRVGIEIDQLKRPWCVGVLEGNALQGRHARSSKGD